MNDDLLGQATTVDHEQPQLGNEKLALLQDGPNKGRASLRRLVQS